MSSLYTQTFDEAVKTVKRFDGGLTVARSELLEALRVIRSKCRKMAKAERESRTAEVKVVPRDRFGGRAFIYSAGAGKLARRPG